MARPVAAPATQTISASFNRKAPSCEGAAPIAKRIAKVRRRSASPSAKTSPMAPPRLKPEINRVSFLQLEIRNGFVRHQNTIGSLFQQRKRGCCVAICEIGVGHGGGPADCRRIDAIKILQIIANIGEAVLHRL